MAAVERSDREIRQAQTEVQVVAQGVPVHTMLVAQAMTAPHDKAMTGAQTLLITLLLAVAAVQTNPADRAQQAHPAQAETALTCRPCSAQATAQADGSQAEAVAGTMEV